MARYRKKPVVIDAWQMQPGQAPEWLTAGSITQLIGDDGSVAVIIVHTLEGDMRAEMGDWIIKGVKGELYPCKPDIFAATYEEVEP
jgi:hypothetical protein